MATTWVDFKAVRAQVRFADVLAWYQVDVRSHGEQASAVCPLPGHEGDRKSRPLSLNLAKGLFKCHKCQRQGNVLDFVTIMEGLDPERPADVRTAALKLIDQFSLHANLRSKQAKVDVLDAARRLNRDPAVSPRNASKLVPPQRQVQINATLDFTLKGLDCEHPYLYDRGLSDATIAMFGLGFCARGMLKDRIVIPLHDHDGRLIGYAGRLVDDDAITDENPKYRFPGRRERNGTAFEFHKSLFLYNGHRIEEPVEDLVVVEGFSSVWSLVQHGIASVVAVMGASCSNEQAHLITSMVVPGGRVWVMPDGDAAGEKCALSVLSQVAKDRWTRWVQLEPGAQPTDVVPDEVHALLSFTAQEKRSGDRTAPYAHAPVKKKSV